MATKQVTITFYSELMNDFVSVPGTFVAGKTHYGDLSLDALSFVDTVAGKAIHMATRRFAASEAEQQAALSGDLSTALASADFLVQMGNRVLLIDDFDGPFKTLDQAATFAQRYSDPDFDE